MASRRLRIVGEPAHRPVEQPSWPEPADLGGPLVVAFDVRGGHADRELVRALRGAGDDGPVLVVERSARAADAPLPEALGPGRWLRGEPGPALWDAIREALAGEGAPTVAVGALAARAVRPDFAVRVDPGVHATTHSAEARGLAALVTLREARGAVLGPLRDLLPRP